MSAVFPKDQVIKTLAEGDEVILRWEILYDQLLPKDRDTKHQLKMLQLGSAKISPHSLLSTMISKWMAQNGSKATVESLIQILRNNGFDSSADKLLKTFRNQNSPARIQAQPTTSKTSRPIQSQGILPMGVQPKEIDGFPSADVIKILLKERKLTENWQDFYDLLITKDGLQKLNKEYDDRSITVRDLFSKIVHAWVTLHPQDGLDDEESGGSGMLSRLIWILRAKNFNSAADELENKLNVRRH